MENIYSDFINNSQASLESELSAKLFADLTSQNLDNVNTFDLIFKSLNNDIYLIGFAKKLLVLLTALALISVILKCLIGNRHYNGVAYITSVIFTFTVTASVYEIILQSCKYIKELSAFFSVCSSTMIVLSASGGNVTTAKTQAFFMPVFLIAVQILINKLIPFCVSFFIGLAIIDSLWGEKKFSVLSKMIKNFFYSIFAFITGMFFIVINTNFKASMSADALSGKTIKLLLSKAIPIVGGNVGDALNFIGGGLVSIKNSIGVISTVFIVALCIPPFLLLFAGSWILSLFSFVSDYCGTGELKGTIAHIKCSIDFTIASLFVLVVIVFVNINLFMNVTPTVIS